MACFVFGRRFGEGREISLLWNFAKFDTCCLDNFSSVATCRRCHRGVRTKLRSCLLKDLMSSSKTVHPAIQQTPFGFLSYSNAVQIPGQYSTIIFLIWLSVPSFLSLGRGFKRVRLQPRPPLRLQCPFKLHLSFGTFAFREIKLQKFLSVVGGCRPRARRDPVLFEHAWPRDETGALSVRHS